MKPDEYKDEQKNIKLSNFISGIAEYDKKHGNDKSKRSINKLIAGIKNIVGMIELDKNTHTAHLAKFRAEFGEYSKSRSLLSETGD